MKKTKFKPSTAIFSTLMLLMGSSTVYAQNASEENSTETDAIREEVIVTGFRRSLANAIDIKRDADSMMEAISADDISGLPDVSIADALARLPGVTAVRTGGQAGEINIRGLSGDFIFATLNGREQVSPSQSRKIEFDQFPSELLSEAAVYKSPKASHIEGGVAGTIEMKTINPLDGKKTHGLNINLRGSYNDRASEVPDAVDSGYRFSTSYQGKFADETLGVALGYARLYQPSVASQFVGLAYKDCADPCLSEGFELQHRGGEETRDGFMATLQWEPADNFSLQSDLYYSKFDREAFARGFRVKTLKNAQLSNLEFGGSGDASGAVIGGTFAKGDNNNFAVQTTNDDNTDKDEVFSAGIKAEWSFEKLYFSVDISHSSAESDFKNGVGWALAFDDASAAVPQVEQDFSVDYTLQGLAPPNINFSDDYTDLDSVMFSKIGIYPYQNTDEVNAIRADFTYNLDIPFIASLEFGLRASDREYTIDRSVFEYGSDFGTSATELPFQLTEDLVEVIDFAGEFSQFPSYLKIDVDRALDQWLGAGNYQPIKSWGSDWTFAQSGTVKEEVFAAYFMANIDTELVGLPLTGNLGLRVVETDQSSTGLIFVGEGNGDAVADGTGEVRDVYSNIVLGQKYTDYLPSLNLNLALTDSQQLRFAAAKVMARPPIDKLKSGGGGWVDGGEYNVWGNTSPYLDPFYATQIDLSYENYFGKDSLFAVGLFNKNIESFIEDITIQGFDFQAAGIPIPLDEDGAPKYENGQFQTARNNTDGGYIRGVEFTYTQTFSFLPGLWQGLGVTGSYSYTESEVEKTSDLGGSTQTISMPGLSPHVFSSTLFYEQGGFSTRVNYRYRDAFVGEQVAVDPQEVFYATEKVVDFQMSYNFDSGLGLLLQVNNLTDEPTKTYFGSEERTGTLQYFGRQVFLGATYKF